MKDLASTGFINYNKKFWRQHHDLQKMKDVLQLYMEQFSKVLYVVDRYLIYSEMTKQNNIILYSYLAKSLVHQAVIVIYMQ